MWINTLVILLQIIRFFKILINIVIDIHIILSYMPLAICGVIRSYMMMIVNEKKER